MNRDEKQANLLNKIKLSRHETTVENVVLRLLESGRYDVVCKHHNYSSPLGSGELDILAEVETPTGRHSHYYEIKCTDSRSSINKAIKQYHRFQKTHPELHTQGIYVTPTRIRRLR